MEITAIDSRDLAGWVASATRVGEVYMTDVSSMVVNVGVKAGRNSITRLNILDHGNVNSIEIGSDVINLANLARFEPTLILLRRRFARNGFVHLQHCHVGSNRQLLIQMARVFNTTVYAGTGVHNPLYRFNWGVYNRATAAGGFQRDVGRP